MLGVSQSPINPTNFLARRRNIGKLIYHEQVKSEVEHVYLFLDSNEDNFL